MVISKLVSFILFTAFGIYFLVKALTLGEAGQKMDRGMTVKTRYLGLGITFIAIALLILAKLF
jgi:hypothetical protein